VTETTQSGADSPFPARSLSTGEWEAAVHFLREALVAADACNIILYANEAAEKLLGWDPGELTGQPLTVMMPTRFHVRHLEGFSRVVDTGVESVIGRPLRVPARRRDGEELHVELLLSRVTVAESPLFIGLLRDVGGRIELEGPAELSDLLVHVFAEASSLTEALPRLVSAIGVSLGWDAVQLWLVDDELQVLRRRAWWNRDAPTRPDVEDQLVAKGEGLVGSVWEEQVSRWSPGTGELTGSGRTFALPVTAEGRFFGVIELQASEPRDPEQVTGPLLALSQGLGTFIERRAKEDERRWLLEVEKSAREAAEESAARDALLAEASALLAETADIEMTLGLVADAAVPTVGSWCIIHLLDGEVPRVVAAAHRDSRMVDLLRRAHERYPVDMDAAGGVGYVLRTGETVRHGVVTEATLGLIARDEAHLDMLRSLSFGAVASFPLSARGRQLGALTVGTGTGDELSDSAATTAAELGHRLAVAIDNHQLHSRLQVAYDELEYQAALLRIQSDAASEGQLIVSPTGEMVSFNRRFAEIWGFPADIIDGRSDEQALQAAAAQVSDPVEFLRRCQELYDRREPGSDRILLQGGRVLDRTGAPLFADTSYLGYAWFFRDVTAQTRFADALSEAGEQSAALARTLQRSLLPPELPEVPGVELAARYHPAGGGVDVGGDFYDVFSTIRGVWGLAIGDVCGKGSEAASMTAFVRYTVRAAAVQARSPAKALKRLNEAMLRHVEQGGPDRFASVGYATLRPGDGSAILTVANGGHPLPFLIRAGAGVGTIGRPGTLLGVLPEVEISDVQIHLRSGDTVVFLTDGVLEARDPAGCHLSDQGVAEVLAGVAGGTAAEVAAAVEQAALAHVQGGVRDDIAVLAFRIL